MKIKHLSKRQRKTAKKIWRSMGKVPGECRVITYCEQCQQVMGARFIPHAIGRGLRVNTCICRLTGNEYRPALTLKSKAC